ncbi:MAG: Uma2 family endonuclease [Chloroflexi bacterium]|nr:Uma2 family endonuclease [Chloroflexota bacterium]
MTEIENPMTLFPDPLIDVQRASVAGNLYTALRVYANLSGLGTAFPPGLFYALWKANPGVNKARVPDASYVRKEHLPNVYDALMPFHGAPDFAVCIVSQVDPTLFTLEHVRDYLAAGTEQVWMIFTAPLREIHVYLRDKPDVIRVYREDDIVDGAPTLPGFKMSAAQVFQTP